MGECGAKSKNDRKIFVKHLSSFKLRAYEISLKWLLKVWTIQHGICFPFAPLNYDAFHYALLIDLCPVPEPPTAITF